MKRLLRYYDFLRKTPQWKPRAQTRRSPRPSSYSKRPFIAAFGSAFLLHLLLLGPLSLVSKAITQPKKQAVHFIDLKEPPKKQRQLVEMNTPPQKKRPTKASYLAEQNHSTKEERVRKTALRDSPKVVPQKAQQKTPPKKPIKRLLAKMKGPTPEKNLANLFPSWQAMAKPSHKSLDHLENVKTGQDTQLNTLQWRHASFFNRLRNRLARIWSPNNEIRKHDPSGKILGRGKRVTLISVSIDREGGLLDLAILEASGVYYLDQEALRTFRASAPFRNPPQALFADKDTFTFEFGFHLNTSNGPQINFDWN